MTEENDTKSERQTNKKRQKKPKQEPPGENYMETVLWKMKLALYNREPLTSFTLSCSIQDNIATDTLPWQMQLCGNEKQPAKCPYA